MSSADFKLDAQLREVPLPDGLLDRLMALPLASDEDVDELLREVPLPPNLVGQLQATALADDEGLDQALRNVPLPDDLVTSCRNHARRLHTRREGRYGADRALIGRIVVAASLILAVTLSLGSAMLLSLGLNSSFFSQVAKHDPQPAPTPKPPTPAEKGLEISLRLSTADASGPVARPLQPGDPTRAIELADVEPAPALDSTAMSPAMPGRADPLALSPGALSGFHPNSWDSLPEPLLRPTALVPHGLDWPVEAGSNRPFLQRYGFHPFVSPAASLRLQSCSVPLATDPSSYELARRYMERNEWPPADRIRTEDFLAAVDYGFPKPGRNQGLGLTVAGGPSPISGEEFCLLQVGVQARQLDPGQQTDRAWHPPLHLVLLIDTSTSMRWGSRMEIIRRALRDLPGIVGPQDRLSLVTFNQAAHVLVEDLGHDGMSQFTAAADALSAEGATNIESGLREAFGVARPARGQGRPAVRVVLLTDGLLDLEPAAEQKIDEQAAQASQQNIPLEVIDLGQQKTTDPQVASLAKSGRGTVHRAASSEQVRWASARSSPAARRSWPVRHGCKSRSIRRRCWSIACWGTRPAIGMVCCRVRWRPISAMARRPQPSSRSVWPPKAPTIWGRSSSPGTHRRAGRAWRARPSRRPAKRSSGSSLPPRSTGLRPRCKRRRPLPTRRKSCAARPSFSSVPQG